MGVLLLIAALVLLLVPGLFAAQATVGWIILAVLGAILAIQLLFAAGTFAFVSRQSRYGRSHFDRW